MENNNISEDDQHNKILSSFLPKQHLTYKTNLSNTSLLASIELIIVPNTNKLIDKTCIVNKQTQMIGHKLMIPILRLLHRAYSNLWELYDLVSIRSNYYYLVIIDDNTRKMWIYGVVSKDIFFSVFKM